MNWKFIGIGLFVALLASCGQKPKSLNELARQVEDSVVLVSYGDTPGHGTGFFVERKGGCRILTVSHVVPEGRQIQITTVDRKLFSDVQVQRRKDVDLAAVDFFVEDSEQCPYPAMALEETDEIEIGEPVLLAGYPIREGAQQLVMQFPDGKTSATAKPPLPEGYAVSYNVTTVGGMSGSPVVNRYGKVLAVHGLTDSELVRISRSQQSGLSEKQKEKLEEIGERSVLARINHFKWGVPVQTYLSWDLEDTAISNNSNRETLDGRETPLPTHYKGWYERGNSLYKLGRYAEASASYDAALELKSGMYQAWYERGNSLHKLGLHEEANMSYAKALELKPHNRLSSNRRKAIPKPLPQPTSDKTWYEQGNLLYRLGRYAEASTSYARAIGLNSEMYQAWYGRGNSLYKLGLYEEASNSYARALEIKPDSRLARSKRKIALEHLSR